MAKRFGLARKRRMHTRKPIRLSTWTLRHKKFKSEVRVAKGIVVSGYEEDISSIKNNSLYLGRVYIEIFGKKNYLKKREEDQYIVINVELDSKITGYTNVQPKEKEVREQEDSLEWD